MDEFLSWLGIDPQHHPVYRRCVEWIMHCAGREDFTDADVEAAVERAAQDATAARQVNNIRTAGTAWIQWRGERAVRAPRDLPEPAWIERLKAQLAARPEIRAAYLADMVAGADDEPRPVLWIELADGVAAPRNVIAELGARLPTCVLDERLLQLRAAEPGPQHELVRRNGLALYERTLRPKRTTT